MKRYSLRLGNLVEDANGALVGYEYHISEVSKLAHQNAGLRAAIWTALDNAHDKSKMIAALSLAENADVAELTEEEIIAATNRFMHRLRGMRT